MVVGDWHWKRMKYEGFRALFGGSILHKVDTQSTCVISMEFREVITSAESRLGEVKYRRE